MAGGTGQGIIESELRQDCAKIVDVHARGKALAAARAIRAGVFVSGVLVQFDAQLRGTLEDVEELSEWKVEERRNYGDRVENGEEAIG